MFSDRPSTRRIAAVVLPLLASEVARASSAIAIGGRPLAVLLDAAPQAGAGVVVEEGARTIDAVDELAHARGVRPGQRVSEAAALTAGLVIARVQARAIEAALARVADVALGLGPTVAVGPPDTVWVDVTGAAHLWGGEEHLLAEIEERVRGLGHRARAALADGPRLARALARFARHARVSPIAPWGRGAEAIAALPVRSLFRLDRADGGDEEVVSLLARLGVATVGDLARLPPAAAAARLGDAAQDVLALAQGRDPAPLVPHAPPARIVEEVSLEDGVESAAALVFVARGLVSRAGARLGARGEASSRIDLELLLDRSIAALRGVDADRAERERLERADRDRIDGAVLTPLPLAASGAANDAGAERRDSIDLELAIDLPAPLAHESDLLRAIKAKLEALVLPAPVVALRLTLSRIAPAPEVQLAMGRAAGGGRAVDPDALPALLSELSAEIGPERLGVLVVRDDHRPEARAELEPPRLDLAATGGETPRRRRGRRPAREPFGARASDFDAELLPSPTRLLRGVATSWCPDDRPSTSSDAASPGGRLARGATILIGRRAFVVEAVAFDRRVDAVRWWTHAPASRDYLRVLLRTLPIERGPIQGALHRGGAATRPLEACVEAWIYVDRRTGEAILQGLWE